MEFRKFDYIDRVHSSQYDFIRIPKAMMDNDGFFGALSIQAKLLVRSAIRPYGSIDEESLDG